MAEKPKRKSLDNLLDDINKRYLQDGAKKPIVSRGEKGKDVIIPCTPPILRYILGGGWVEGKLHEIFGKEAAGKTSLVFSAMKDIYEYYDGTKKMGFIDIEHKINEEWAATMGVNLEDLVVVQPPDAESATDIMADLIRTEEFCCFVWDSVGASAPSKEHGRFEDAKDVMGGVAKIMSRNVKTMIPLANYYGVTLFYLNQLRADMAGYNRPITPGGLTLKHMASRRIYVRPGKDKYEARGVDGKPVQVGYPMFFKAVKNSYGQGMLEGSADFYFAPSDVYLDHVGFDVEENYTRLGLALGVIQQGGPWYTFGSVKEKGRQRFFEALEEAGLKESLIKEVDNNLSGATNLGNNLSTPDIEPEGIDISDPEV